MTDMAVSDVPEQGRAAACEGELNRFDYFTEIEDFFIRRRGKILLLSPMDWALIESWKEKGVPLHVVLRGIERTFDHYDKRTPGARRRSIKTLLYCEEEVEAQYAEWLETQVGRAATENGDAQEIANERTDANGVADPSTAAQASRDDAFPAHVVSAHLTNAHERIIALQATGRCGDVVLSPQFRETLHRVENRLRELILDWRSTARPSAERLEDALTQLERLLNESLPGCYTPTQLQIEEQAAQAQLAAYKARMDVETYRTTLANLLRKRLHERCGIPRLSLFHL